MTELLYIRKIYSNCIVLPGANAVDHGLHIRRRVHCGRAHAARGRFAAGVSTAGSARVLEIAPPHPLLLRAYRHRNRGESGGRRRRNGCAIAGLGEVVSRRATGREGRRVDSVP